MNQILEIKNLSVDFDGFKAVDDVDLTLDRGKVIGIVGESGSGKSVTQLAMMGLIPYPGKISAEKMIFDGNDLLTMPENQRKKLTGKDIAMIFQEPMTSLNPCFTVEFQLCEALKYHEGGTKKQRRARAVELLEQVGIPAPEDRLKSFPHQLSGGISQRVMIAMALACNPELMIADEPTTALDVTIQAQILDLIRDLQGKLGMSVLFITHDLGIVAQNTQRVVVMYAGKVVEEAETKELFRDPRHPYTRGLLRSLPGQQGNIQGKTKLPSIPGMVPDPLALPAGCYFRDRCPDAFDRCENAMPPLSLCGDPQHLVRCWLYTEETS
jgi:dipeptide transport system ATP-binding protein